MTVCLVLCVWQVHTPGKREGVIILGEKEIKNTFRTVFLDGGHCTEGDLFSPLCFHVLLLGLGGSCLVFAWCRSVIFTASRSNQWKPVTTLAA